MFMSASLDISLKVEPWGPTYLCCLLLNNYWGDHSFPPFPSPKSLPFLNLPPFLLLVFLPPLPLLHLLFLLYQVNLFSLPFLLYIPSSPSSYYRHKFINMDVKVIDVPTLPAISSSTLSSVFPETPLSRLLLLLINKIIKVGLLANVAILLPFINNKVTLWIFTWPRLGEITILIVFTPP